MEILEIVIPIAAICNFFLGFFVFLKDPSKRLNRFFGISCFLAALWIFANFMMGIQQTLFWVKSASAFGVLLPLTALLWILELCEKKITKRQLEIISSLGLFFFFISYIDDLVIANVRKVYLGGFEGETGPLFIPFWIYILSLLILIVYTLISGYRKFVGIKKLQISYVIIGVILYIGTVSIVSFILPLFGIEKFTPLDSPSSLFLLFFTALAITRYHLFGIEVILTEILVGVIGILLLVQIFVAPSTLWKIVNGGIFVLFCIFGYLLIRGVFREIRRREELERISRAKTEFISITSHQLRTPLTVIKGYLSMILEGVYGEVSEKLKKVLENIYLANERLIKLVNSFLNVSKIELGKLELELERADIVEIVESVVKEMEIAAKEKNLYLKFEKPKEVPKILIDKEKIREIILNLVDNAIKYTQEGGVEVKLQILNNRLQIVVADTGEGLTKEEKEKLFESFSRGSAGQKYWVEGAGIGLYVAKKIVELHQGKIWVESEGKGKGSKFYVELPIT